MTPAVSFVAGSSFLILGLSYLVRQKDWRAWLRHLREQGHKGSLTVGTFQLIAGSFLLGFHWTWEGGWLVLTLVGVVLLLKGAILLLFPSWLPKQLRWMEPHYTLILPMLAVLCIGLSLGYFWEWKQLVYPYYMWQPSV